MFWKFIEFLVRLVNYKSFRQADRIGVAAKLAGEGKLEEALLSLDELGPKIHPPIKSVYLLIRGRILSALGRLDEAEKAFIESARADPSNAKAHLELSVMAGRRFRFEDARARLDKLVSDADEDIKKEANEILTLLDQVTSGEREAEFERRALAMAGKTIGPNGETAGLPPDLKLIDIWISRIPEEAREAADEIALLMGQSEVQTGEARWKVGLSIEESLVLRSDHRELNPFKVVALRFSSKDKDLPSLYKEGWKEEVKTN